MSHRKGVIASKKRLIAVFFVSRFIVIEVFETFVLLVPQRFEGDIEYRNNKTPYPLRIRRILFVTG